MHSLTYLVSVELDNEMFAKQIEEARVCSIIIVDLNSKEIPLKVSHCTLLLLSLISLSIRVDSALRDDI